MITDITSEVKKNFESKEPVIPEGKTALVFHIPGHCAGCKRAIGMLEKRELTDWNIYLIDAESDNNLMLVDKYNISTAPTIVVYKDGQLTETMTGLQQLINNLGIFD